MYTYIYIYIISYIYIYIYVNILNGSYIAYATHIVYTTYELNCEAATLLPGPWHCISLGS